MPQARILIGDDNHTILDRVQLLLNEEFDVIEAVDNGPALINRAVELRPDVIVTDICISGCSSLNVAVEMHRRLPKTKLVFLSMIQSDGLCEDVLAAGASAYVLKERASTDLVAAVRAALAGRRYVSPRATGGG